jgi:hypothetical protein
MSVTPYPTEFKFYIGGYFDYSFVVEWHDDHLHYQKYSHAEGHLPDPPIIVQPTARQWKSFWKTVESCKVWDWPEECQTEVLTTDGTSWELHLACGEQRVSSGGENAYPESDSNEPSPVFKQFLTAARRLLGGLDLH